MNTSIHHSEEISERLSKNNLLESVKTVSELYVVSIITSMFQTGYCGKQLMWKAAATDIEPVFHAF